MITGTMPKIETIRAAIFDVDDTLLDNGGTDDPTLGLHALSRLSAVHEVGRLHNLPELAAITSQQNIDAFHTAKTHSLAAAVWNILRAAHVVTSEDIDPDNELFMEIVALKNSGHEAILRAHGKEVPDAGKFIRTLASYGLQDMMAIASSAVRRDIDLFFDMNDLHPYFPDPRIVSLERVSKLKPDKESFDSAFLSLHLPDSARRSVLAFEDDPRGVQSARDAGLFVCGITTRFRSTPEVLAAADVIADSYVEFAEGLGIQLVAA